MTKTVPGDIRHIPPEKHWAHFARSWKALKTYTYLGKETPYIDAGVVEETMPLRHDMRNAGGGIMVAPLCILAPEPYWRDDACVPAPVSMSYQIVDPAHDVTRLLVQRDVIHVGRQMGFSRSRIVDYHNHDRIIAVACGSGVSLGDVPPGFEPVDNPLDAVVDAPDMPSLRDAFGITADPGGGLAIAGVTPEIATPHATLHLGPIAIALEGAAMDAAACVAGGDAFQAESGTVLMVKPGTVGPFVATAAVVNPQGTRIAVEAQLADQGMAGRIVATASFVFHRLR
ncbi:hypothetical protein NT2_04_02120 [Caenibius tardaugens NBRC 16725]|uniref:Thioesterase domain-containing protein n=1 Tax=Caenibius tardaugens NBRC 16725 TaxID=1219035 RepID=U2YJZ9_9SPHN|nr:hypothetical protein [Caenibius tardaugens]GAD48800.1 hypothetical protein NT2_04_02120 [Caenibius tardaugens NBRC 16725]